MGYQYSLKKGLISITINVDGRVFFATICYYLWTLVTSYQLYFVD